jgi:hypothetical protein
VFERLIDSMMFFFSSTDSGQGYGPERPMRQRH